MPQRPKPPTSLTINNAIHEDTRTRSITRWRGSADAARAREVRNDPPCVSATTHSVQLSGTSLTASSAEATTLFTARVATDRTACAWDANEGASSASASSEVRAIPAPRAPPAPARRRPPSPTPASLTNQGGDEARGRRSEDAREHRGARRRLEVQGLFRGRTFWTYARRGTFARPRGPRQPHSHPSRAPQRLLREVVSRSRALPPPPRPSVRALRSRRARTIACEPRGRPPRARPSGVPSELTPSRRPQTLCLDRIHPPVECDGDFSTRALRPVAESSVGRRARARRRLHGRPCRARPPLDPRRVRVQR